MMQIGEQEVRLNLMQKWDMNELDGQVVQGEIQHRPLVTFNKCWVSLLPTQPNLLGWLHGSAQVGSN